MSKRTKKAVAQVAVNDGGSVSTPPTGWGDLPLEVLIEIFSKLEIEVDQNGYPISKKEKKALLNSRMQNKMWKKAVDDVLQKQALKFWTAWRPHVSNQRTTGYPHIFGKLYLEPALPTAITPRSDICVPSFLKTKTWNNSPSPSNSVCVTQKQGVWLTQRKYKSWIRKDVDVFAKFGQHLTSITFFDIRNLDISTLQKFLSHTPNLEAMALQRIIMKRSCHCIGNTSLHPLPKLAHLKLLDSYFPREIFIWILNRYKGRLATLETNYWYQDDKLDLDGVPNLKKLKIFMDDLDCESLPIPSVTHLSLIDFPLGDLRLVKELPYLLHKSTTTLFQLHIQLDRNKIATMEVSPEHDNWEFPTLSQVKIFVISYPKCPKGLEAVQRLVKMLPNLNQLSFIQFHETVGDREATEYDKETVRNHLLESQYWRVCKKLTTISVSMKADDGSNAFYTMHFPFIK